VIFFLSFLPLQGMRTNEEDITRALQGYNERYCSLPPADRRWPKAISRDAVKGQPWVLKNF